MNNNLNKADKNVLAIKQKYEEMHKQMDKNTDYGQVVDMLTLPFFHPLVRRHFAQSIADTRVLLEAYGVIRSYYGELAEENQKLKAELQKANAYINKLQDGDSNEEEYENCEECPNAGSCLSYIFKQMDEAMDNAQNPEQGCGCDGCTCGEEEDDETDTEDVMVVAVTWLDGGTVVFKANSIRQVKGGELHIDIDTGTVVIPMASVRFYTVE